MDAPLTVLIPSHGRPTLLGRTLASVAACARPPGYARCLVVENGPAAGAEAVVAAAAAACPEAAFAYLHHGRANKSAALNAALDGVPDGHLAVFLDDDVRLAPGALVAYAEAAGARGGGAFFGGPTESDFEARPPDWLLPLLPASVRGVGEAELAEMGYFLGANWAAWVSDLRGAGGFDPNFGPGSPTGARGQESEMQRRLGQAKMTAVFVPEAVVWHYVPRERSSPSWAVQRMYRSGLGNGALARRGAGSRMVRLGVHTIVKAVPRLGVSYLTRSTSDRTRAKAELAYWAGYLRGYAASTTN